MYDTPKKKARKVRKVYQGIRRSESKRRQGSLVAGTVWRDKQDLITRDAISLAIDQLETVFGQLASLFARDHGLPETTEANGRSASESRPDGIWR